MATYTFNIFVFMAGVLMLLLLGTLFLFYHQKRKAGLDLTLQIKEQEHTTGDQKKMTIPSVVKPDKTSYRTDSKHVNKKSNNDPQYQLLVSRLRNYVLKDQNYAKPDIDRDEFIAALSTNRTTLSEAVKTVTNKTLMEYINYLRLEEAKQMLDKHSELTIEAIAEKCGFNLRTFHRLFIDIYQVSPAKYRKNSIGNNVK